MGQNLSPSCKKIQIWSKGFKVTSQKADFERESTLVHPNHIHIKVALEGLDWYYISPEWQKVAEVG